MKREKKYLLSNTTFKKKQEKHCFDLLPTFIVYKAKMIM